MDTKTTWGIKPDAAYLLSTVFATREKRLCDREVNLGYVSLRALCPT